MSMIPLLIAVAALAGAALSARGAWRRRGVSRWPEATARVADTELEALGVGRGVHAVVFVERQVGLGHRRRVGNGQRRA
ncbi:hypothetical protein [Halomonas urmiana]|uniref:hypothetical protein n=1 Tax=Halomonas urmiana TaxID=490901 RepID=UPI0013053F7C